MYIDIMHDKSDGGGGQVTSRERAVNGLGWIGRRRRRRWRGGDGWPPREENVQLKSAAAVGRAAHKKKQI